LIRADFEFEEGPSQKGYVTNLSQGGAFLAIRQSVPKDTKLKLILSLPWQLGRVEFNARVAWVRGEDESQPGNSSAGLGLQFLKPTPEAIEKIEQYLTRFRKLAESLPSSVT
jgi:Tfp pilus assembly protein PilZ